MHVFERERARSRASQRSIFWLLENPNLTIARIRINKYIYSAFYIHLLEFLFIYQFYSWMTTHMESTFWNPGEVFVFKSVHNHFKLFWYDVLHKMRGIFFAHISFQIQQTKPITFNHLRFHFSCHSSWKYILKCRWTRKLN